MSDINKVNLIGNLGDIPEVIPAGTDLLVANLSVATNRSWIDRKTGELSRDVQWHKVAYFFEADDKVVNALKKGDKVLVEGRLQTSKYRDTAGIDRQSTEIVALNLQKIDTSMFASV